MAKNKATVQQTAARRIMDTLKRRQAFSPDTAVGYDAFKNIPYPTQVIAYTIANLMENGVVQRTGDERFYFVDENWKKLSRKVSSVYIALIGLPLIVFLIFLAIKFLL